MKLRRETIVTALALLVVAAAIPFAIMDTVETGRGSPGRDQTGKQIMESPEARCYGGG